MFYEIIDFTKAGLDGNGIFVVNNKTQIKYTGDEKADENNIMLLKKKLDDIVRNKLADHWDYIRRAGVFTDKTIYLEIGCWPAFLGEYLMKNFDTYFIGVDFNYTRLLTLKKYFEEKGYKKYALICGDINHMPIKNNSVDFVYGGGVIEHLKDTRKILDELFRVLKPGGISYNTVPAFSFWWLTRFYNTTPEVPLMKELCEFFQYKIFRGNSFKKHHGCQKAFVRRGLKNLHEAAGFKDVTTGTFAFHPSDGKLKSKILRDFMYKIRQWTWSAAIFFVYGKK